MVKRKSTTLKKYAKAYNECIKKALIAVKKSNKSSRGRSRSVSSRSSGSESSRSRSSSRSSSESSRSRSPSRSPSPRPKKPVKKQTKKKLSKWQLFVKAEMKKKKYSGMTAPERLKEISKLWKGKNKN